MFYIEYKMEWNSWRGTYKDHPVQLPDYFPANQELRNVTEDIIQMLLEH